MRQVVRGAGVGGVTADDGVGEEIAPSLYRIAVRVGATPNALTAPAYQSQ